ncbi:acetyl-CoA carboxylase biotin carboxyl carrier protein [Saccharopolyspora sp. 5N708]|uniref:acetyl-CoA carboxylase biotin carboxyl carrier protein n=1 Tax=Saccharopolyspora sp. 5N708 TaxID=3457424 RepID=UPI003FD5BF9F
MSEEERGLFDAVVRGAGELLAAAGTPPTRLLARAGEVSVELEWPAASRELPGEARTTPASASAELCAPIVGVFYHAPSPGEPPFVAVGDLVRPGQQVGIVEAMKTMIPVEADQRGRIDGVLVADGTPVEYGEPLFTLEPATALEPLAS